jgi:hypothetical protein
LLYFGQSLAFFVRRFTLRSAAIHNGKPITYWVHSPDICAKIHVAPQTVIRASDFANSHLCVLLGLCLTPAFLHQSAHDCLVACASKILVNNRVRR